MKTCFGLFAILRSDTQNDAMFDPDFCGVWALSVAMCFFRPFFSRNYDFPSPQNRFKGPKAVRFNPLRNSRKPKKKAQPQGLCFFSLVAEMGFEPHDLPHQSHSRRLSLSQDYSSADSLLCGVSRRKNDNQSFLLVRRLFALRSQGDLGLITSKVIKSSHNRSQKEKIQSPKRVTEFLWLRRWDLQKGRVICYSSGEHDE